MFVYEILTNDSEARKSGICNIVGMSGTSIAYRDCKTNDVSIADARDIKLQPLRI